jgi:indolepyruvate decarboxylase
MGCESWFSARVRTVAELDAALERAQQHDGASYIEIMIAAEESQPLPENVLEQIYHSTLSTQS